MRYELDTAPITSFDDTINSGDLNARIDELEGIKGTAKTVDVVTELESLTALRNEVLSYTGSEFELIRETYFVEWVKDYALDTGQYIPDLAVWPYNHVNWAAAAKELRAEYTEIVFNNTGYWVK
jgi:hypothetical protein